MKTESSVVDGRSRLPHELVGQITRRTNELLRRIDEGTLDFQKVMNGLQHLIENSDRGWYEKDGVIYFSVTSDGTTGEQWIGKLQVRGKIVGNYAKQLLWSEKFSPTSGVTYSVAMMKGEVFSDGDRQTSNIRAEAKRREFTTPSAEVACLIRQKFSDTDIKVMGLNRIVTFHKHIQVSDGRSGLLGWDRYEDSYIMNMFWDRPYDRWNREHGFVFLAQ